VGKWLFGRLPEQVQGTAWCQNLRLVKTQLLAPSSAWYSLRKVLKLSIFYFQSESFTNKNVKIWPFLNLGLSDRFCENGDFWANMTKNEKPFFWNLIIYPEVGFDPF